MRLRHLHIPKPIPYTHSLQIQKALLDQHFAVRRKLREDISLTDRARFNDALLKAQPPPTLLTFQTQPTYTVGRRYMTSSPLSESQVTFLQGQNESGPRGYELAAFHAAPRGGMVTYHAPGQLTAYLILDLRTQKLTPEGYVHMLEDIVMQTLAKHGLPNTTITPDTGVWVTEKSSEGTKATNRKICAIGIHISQGVTSHGIGLNVFDAPIELPRNYKGLYTIPKNSLYDTEASASTPDPAQLKVTPPTSDVKEQIPAPGYLSWGFSRIIACGLEGKQVTWLSRERSSEFTIPSLRYIADALAFETAHKLKIDPGNVQKIEEEDITAAAPKSWDFLRSLSGEVEKTREYDFNAGYRIRDIRRDSGLRIV